MTTSFTVAPNAFLIDLMVSSDDERMANLRCAVMGALNGVLGARSVTRDDEGSWSVSRVRPTLRTRPTGPRRLSRHWFAMATSTGLRVAWPISRARRALSTKARPG